MPRIALHTVALLGRNTKAPVNPEGIRCIYVRFYSFQSAVNILLKPHYSVSSLILKENKKKKVGFHFTYIRQQIIFTFYTYIWSE